MDRLAISISTRWLYGVLIGAAALSAVLTGFAGSSPNSRWLVQGHSEATPSGVMLLFVLALAAVAAGAISSLGQARPAPRFALTFGLTAMVLLPPPAGWVVLALAAIAGRGAGVWGRLGDGFAAFTATVTAAALCQALPQIWTRALSETPLALTGPGARGSQLLLAALLYVMLLVSTQLIHRGIRGRLVSEAPTRSLAARLPAPWRRTVVEGLNVFLAWLLGDALARGAVGHAAALIGVPLVLATLLRKLDRAVRDLHGTNDALAQRLTELATLHAISREVLSTLDPQRVCRIIERECRKIFDVDYCVIALADPRTNRMHGVYQHLRGELPRIGEEPIDSRLISRVVEDKRGHRVDDLWAARLDSGQRQELADPKLRSALSVPLIVEDRVVGALSIQSRTLAAYDDHQLAVLTTIAQQAAVAIENAKHYEMATVDSLTRFYSRDHFFKRLEEEHNRVARYGGRFALLMLDLDGFKQINDDCGHLAGDHYLKAVSTTVRSQLRDADLPCRYGGDEFCVLLPETDLQGAKVIGERIREAVSGRIVGADGHVVRTTISVGVAAFSTGDEPDLTSLLRNADEALYRAKRQGRNCVVAFAA